MQKSIFLFALIIIAAIAMLAFVMKKQASLNIPQTELPAAASSSLPGKFTISPQRILSHKKFVSKHGFSDQVMFLIDMSLPSGSKRFFVFDLKKDSIVHAGLVTHGNCFQYWLEGRKYSNEVGSGCTSVGRYRVGQSYNGKFGLAFKLYGLDTTNNNAFERYVVMHSHACVPEKETKEEISQSNGCPTLNPHFLSMLQGILSKSKKPVLLDIFEQ